MSIRREAGEAEAGTELISGFPGGVCMWKLRRNVAISWQSVWDTVRATDRGQAGTTTAWAVPSATRHRSTGSGHSRQRWAHWQPWAGQAVSQACGPAREIWASGPVFANLFFAHRRCVHAVVYEREGLWLLGWLFLWFWRGWWPYMLLEEKLSARKEINDGAAPGSDLMMPLLFLSGRSARQEISSTLLTPGWEVLPAGWNIMWRHNAWAYRRHNGDQWCRDGHLSISKVIVFVFWD